MSPPSPPRPDPGTLYVHEGRTYLRAPVPLHFPEHETVPETKLHLELRTLLYQVLKLAFGNVHAIGCDQFVYWDASDPRRCLAPDGFVRKNADDELFPVWKTWERGAPHVAIEIVSATDRDLGEQLARYRQMGVVELIRFDCDDLARPLRVWDRVDEDLVERSLLVVTEAECTVLPVIWTVVPDPALGPSLRPADRSTRVLLPSPSELAISARDQAEAERGRAEAERERAEAERERAEAERERADDAERRLRELEVKLSS